MGAGHDPVGRNPGEIDKRPLVSKKRCGNFLQFGVIIFRSYSLVFLNGGEAP
jgi:hypothetical protein